MNITNDQLGQITFDVCEAMLGLELEKTDPVAVEQCDPDLVACVCISGEWNAAIEVAVCNTAASSIANAMFACEQAEPDEVVDAVAEIANMIGGNIKGIAGGECQLSLPCVGNTVMERGPFASIALGLGDGDMQVFLKNI